MEDSAPQIRANPGPGPNRIKKASIVRKEWQRGKDGSGERKGPRVKRAGRTDGAPSRKQCSSRSRCRSACDAQPTLLALPQDTRHGLDRLAAAAVEGPLGDVQAGHDVAVGAVHKADSCKTM